MAYFDNPENREGWEKVMVGLRKERERRLSGEEPSDVVSAKDELQADRQAYRIPVTIGQLEKEEREAVSSRGTQHYAKHPEREIENPTPAMSGSSL